MKISVAALAALWVPLRSLLNLSAGAALARGYMRMPETAHYELLTMEIYTRALRCALVPGRTAFKVTPKQGARRRRPARRAQAPPRPLLHGPAGAGTADAAARPGRRRPPARPAGRSPPSSSPASGSSSCGGCCATTWAVVGRRRQRRLVYRFEGDAAAELYTPAAHTRRGSSTPPPPGWGWSPTGPLEVGSEPARPADPDRRGGRQHEVAAKVEVRTCREVRGELPDRGDDPRDRPRRAAAADGVVLRRLQPRAPARPPARDPAARVGGDRRLPRRLPRGTGGGPGRRSRPCARLDSLALG